MQKHLADIYAKIFQLFTVAVEWYTTSSMSRLKMSLSDKLPKQLDEMVTDINTLIRAMYREGDLATAAEMRDTRVEVEEIHDSVSLLYEHSAMAFEQSLRTDAKVDQLLKLRAEATNIRVTSGNTFNIHISGVQALALLQSLAQIGGNEQSTLLHTQTGPCSETVSRSSSRSSLERESAIAAAKSSIRRIAGHSGLELLVDAPPRFVTPDVMYHLEEWISSTDKSSVLWISCDLELHSPLNSARSAACAVLAAFVGSKSPFISHFSESLDPVRSGSGLEEEETGLLGLLYGLISQLLEFRDQSGDDILDAKLDLIHQLDGTMKSWRSGITLLGDLLENTVVPYCVIDNIAILDHEAGCPLFAELLDLILERQRPGKPVFNVLLTSNGQSETLFEKIPTASSVIVERESYFAKYGGQLLELDASQMIGEIAAEDAPG